MSAPSPRSDRVRSGLAATAGVAWRLLVIAAALWLLGYLLGKVWVVVLPVVLALFVTTLLWPATKYLRAHKWPPALAAATVVLAFLAVLLGLSAVIVVPVASQSEEVTDGVTDGIESIQEWLAGPPLNLGNDQVGAALDDGLAKLKEMVGDIVGAVLGGISAIGSAVVAIVLILILVFFYLKDGPRFIPWLAEQSGVRAAPHVVELGKRYYASVSSFTVTQGIVGLLDAVIIGVGLLLVGVPLVLPLAVLTFVGAFVPIIGAFVAGAVAVLIALVSNGVTAALIVLAIVVVVQQLEGNLFAPMLQGKSLQLHAAVVILAVIAGSSLAGVTGAFLAVPVAALIAITWRYAREHLADDAVGPDPREAAPTGRTKRARPAKTASASDAPTRRKPSQ